MRILFIGFDNSETFLERLIHGLTKKGMDLTLSSTSRKLSEKFATDNIEILWTPSWSGNPLIRMLNILLLILTSLSQKRLHWLFDQISKQKGIRNRLIAANRYLPFCRGNWDLIYFPWNATAIDYYGLYELDIPVVVSCRGSHLKIKPVVKKKEDYIKGLRNSLINAQGVHCISQNLKTQALIYGGQEKTIKVIYPAINTDFFKPLHQNHKNENVIITMVGSLIWTKGYEYALIAFDKVLKSGIDTELHIIGEGYERERINFTIHDLGIEKYVKLCGQLPISKVRDQLQRSDIFLHTSLSEGFCNAVLEAQACGVPVVCFNEGGLPENVINEKTGFLVPIRDVDAMAKKLIELANHPEIRKVLSNAGRFHVLKSFRIEDQISDFIQFFQASI